MTLSPDKIRYIIPNNQMCFVFRQGLLGLVSLFLVNVVVLLLFFRREKKRLSPLDPTSDGKNRSKGRKTLIVPWAFIIHV